VFKAYAKGFKGYAKGFKGYAKSLRFIPYIACSLRKLGYAGRAVRAVPSRAEYEYEVYELRVY
jgi:hypothetical protein